MSDAAAPLGRILVVDDEKDLVRALCDTLADRGYEVEGATAGQVALEVLRERAFDVLLADLRMPQPDGVALIRAALEMEPNLVCTIMTGHGTIESAVEAMKSGAFDYVLKPIKLQALLSTLARAMEVRRLRVENVQLRETVAIYELSAAIAHTLDPGTIVNKAADAALQQSQADEASIMLFTDEGDALYVAAGRGERLQAILGERVPLDRGIAGWVARCREPLVLHGEVADPRFAPVQAHPQIRSGISLPMLAGGKVVGVLNANRIRSTRPFEVGQIKGLSILAGLAASALESARLHEALRQEALLLEAKVEDRTRELEEARRRAEAASLHKSEFLANMSHELRTPLNSVIGFSELLQEQTIGPLNEKQVRFLGNIARSGQHLLHLINDILDLSKVEAGKIVLQLEPLPVVEVLEDILVIARGLANKKSQALAAEIARDLPPLLADPVRFKQILFNLLSNAVKFTPAGGAVRVTARRNAEHPGGARMRNAEWKDGEAVPESAIRNPQSEIGDFLEIAVTDTGAGIRSEDLPRLFQEFTQLATTAAQAHEGTGLGLALTRRLVELHGGAITAASEGEGKGSTFTVRLPVEGVRVPCCSGC